ncbi:MAG TPA: hypothetical protein VFV92_11990 [Candidatus Bathyarchaeia archaeon]|nr:hypothetical protein [Candidatus Bathyarchaeia archaeon]
MAADNGRKRLDLPRLALARDEGTADTRAREMEKLFRDLFGMLRPGDNDAKPISNMTFEVICHDPF